MNELNNKRTRVVTAVLCLQKWLQLSTRDECVPVRFLRACTPARVGMRCQNAGVIQVVAASRWDASLPLLEGQRLERFCSAGSQSAAVSCLTMWPLGEKVALFGSVNLSPR